MGGVRRSEAFENSSGIGHREAGYRTFEGLGHGGLGYRFWDLVSRPVVPDVRCAQKRGPITQSGPGAEAPEPDRGGSCGPA